LKSIVLIESAPQIITLTAVEAEQLRSIGRRLKSEKGWWGHQSDTEEETDRSAIWVQQAAATAYSVTVSNAVGAIALGDLQLFVHPKIPLHHLLYLLDRSEQSPRSSDERGSVGGEDAFHVVVARWFLNACEKLLRLGLDRDYEQARGDLAFARGRIVAVPTARSILAGRPVIRCEFDNFSEDMGLNRVLRAAARHVLASPLLPGDLRRRGRWIYEQLDGCGELRHDDRSVKPDFRRHHYSDSYQLALIILSSGGILPSPGLCPAWTFLFRTPDAVEQGVRGILHDSLTPHWHVEKKGKRLFGNRNRTLAPDLVFNSGDAVGDVKYKLTMTGDIDRPHLNQVTTFATGFDARKAAVIAFGPHAMGEQVQVGEVVVEGLNWNTDEPNPDDAAIRLVQTVATWLAEP